MSEARQVRCLDCGHEWSCKAQYPQCSDPNDECGRSRNVEPVSELESDSGSVSERDPEPSGDSGSEGEWSPLFETQESETEPVEDMSISDPPEVEGLGASEPEPSADESATQQAAEQVPELEPEDIELFVKTPFDMAAKSRGEHWELGEDETQQLSVAYAKLGNKYMPYMLAEHAPEVMAGITTVAVIGPRLAEDKNQAEDEKEPEADTEARQESDRMTAEQSTKQQRSAYDRL